VRAIASFWSIAVKGCGNTCARRGA
jgi:hypothetical protein